MTLVLNPTKAAKRFKSNAVLTTAPSTTTRPKCGVKDHASLTDGTCICLSRHLLNPTKGAHCVNPNAVLTTAPSTTNRPQCGINDHASLKYGTCICLLTHLLNPTMAAKSVNSKSGLTTAPSTTTRPQCGVQDDASPGPGQGQGGCSAPRRLQPLSHAPRRLHAPRGLHPFTPVGLSPPPLKPAPVPHPSWSVTPRLDPHPSWSVTPWGQHLTLNPNP